tara:strand:+ start:997 stop:1254 length:258 start_codon:yes stop_codon:yes gene_type:complete
MSYFVYMIQTECSLTKKTYVGYTNNLEKRIKLHNKGKGAKSTKGRKWKLIYYETYNTKNEALKNEYSLKKNYYLRKKIKEKYLKK